MTAPATTWRAARDLLVAGRRIRYGEHRDQAGDLRVPAGSGPHPVVVVLHGGSWGARWTRHTTRPLAGALHRLGVATWNVEYRRIGRGGGWPATLADTGAAIDALADLDAALDLAQVHLVGHSAGGHLALWAAGRPRLPDDFPGARPRVLPASVLGLAPVTSLFPGAAGLLGAERHAQPRRWALADPTAMLPLGVPALLVHGAEDRMIPASSSERYARRARGLGDDVEVLTLPGLGHADVIDPRGPAWSHVAAWITARLAAPGADARAAAS